MKRFVCHINNLLMRIGKPLALTGIILLLAMCGSDNPSGETDGVEYTDVEYEEDGAGVTIYLDGKGVPKTRSQRAVTTDLAKMAFDFVEVIFVDNGSIARTSWVLGESANITGVPGKTGGSVEYTNIFGTNNTACIFVGKDDGKVLLGVGKLTGTKPVISGTNGAFTIDANTTSVTFTIAAIKTGLIVDGETTATEVNGYTVSADSFNYSYTVNTTDYSRTGNSFRRPLPPTGSIRYPVYVLPPNEVTTTTTGTYEFSIDAGYASAIRHVRTTNPDVFPVVQKKTPRYATNGRYEEPRNRIDAYTTVAIAPGYTTSAADTLAFVASVPLVFTTTSSSIGFFAFNMQIPVFMVNRNPATNTGGTAAKTWYIRTGLGSEFYSLDDGVSRGGCVFISVAVPEAEFENIEWTWFKGF